MKIKPVGFKVLVEVSPVEEKSPGGIITSLPNELERERKGRDVGKILAFGPICFQGYADCKTPADWGVKIGDLVEFNRYDGKETRMAEVCPEMKNYRYINDNDIIAVIEE